MRRLCILLILVFLLALPFAFAAPDAYEPDDTYLTSKNIPTDGTWQTHTFDPADDMDYMNFSATAGAYYLIRTVNLTSADITDAQLFVGDTNGITPLSADSSGLVGDDWSARIVWRANNTATYYLMVNESNGTAGGSYNISVLKLGTVSPYLVYPSSWMNASKHQNFNFTAGVTCVGGPCYNVVAILDPKKDDQPARLDSEVAERLGSEEEVAVIVKLKGSGDEQSLIAGREDDKKSLKRNIRNRQDSVLGSMDVEDLDSGGGASAASDVDFRLKHRYSTLNGFAGTVTRKGLQKLLNNPDVEYVSFDRPVEAALYQSVPLINANDVWNLQVDGISINGSGQTVCVIDTGVSYTHADFGSCTTPQFLAGTCPKVVGGYDFVNSDYDPIDDHYHGTHCAGIVASQDSTYKGVAPGAKLVAMKVLNASGSGTYSNIAAAVDWCVDNATLFNISVISMSIGSWYVYDNNGFGCEDYEPVMTEAINNAVANDIFVAVAAGNRYTSGDVGIALPACIRNATSVGITDKSDNLIAWGQRGFTLDLMAPGYDIYSTYFIGGHAGSDGTSMSTPHVAGTAALVQQYFRLKYNRTLAPKDIERMMKFSGKSLYDATTGMNYTRVDSYNAVTDKGPVSTTIGALPFYTTDANPHDSSCLSEMADGESCNVSWIVNATGDLGNYTFFAIFETDYMSNITSKLNITIVNSPPVLSSPNLNNATGNTTTVFNFSVNYSDADNNAPSFILVFINSTNYSMLPEDVSDTNYSDGKIYYYETLLAEGNYTHYFNASDGFNTTLTSVVYAPNVTDNVAPVINLSSPADNANVSAAFKQFAFNATDESAEAINCSLWFDGVVVNYTVLTTEISAVLSHTILSQGAHLWNISCNDSKNVAVSATRTITYDATPPLVTLKSPADGTVLYANVSDFAFNVTDNLFSTLSCTLYAAGSVYASDPSVSNATDTTFSSVELTAGALSWLVNCTDPASNSANSSSRSIIVPQQNSTASVSTTANVTYDLSATTEITVNLTTNESTAGTVA
ncbi:S8 family serine peptidase, partial [Candidatus Woesearchaeota archaeon]|nr:S8 family serine peptidase [Candidatus Woesearchaeota archaeon]